MEAHMPTEQMWTLSEDQEVVRMHLAPVQIEGIPKRVIVSLSFNAANIDEVLERLTVLRAQMLPAPTRNCR